ILPPRLKKGDTVGIISPASSPNKKELVKGLSFLKRLGLNVQLGKFTKRKYGYLAGSDEERLVDFHHMIETEEIKGIIFARGGYGTARIVPHIDFNLVQNNPKIIWGFSDITYLHTSIRQQTGLITFHGPMVMSVGKKECDEMSKQSFKQLFEPTEIVYDESISSLHIISEGEVTGEIVGGNLSLLRSSIGTPYEIDLNGKILLIEDVGEPPYKIDSMLNQLILSGKLDHVKGIVIGDFNMTNDDDLPLVPLREGY